MASSRQREEERRLSVRTLAIASLASASAAIVTSYFWTGGTPIAAAVTPVVVALVSELLHRPTERIAERFTRESTAILPDAAGAAPPPEPDADSLPARAPAEPGSPGAPQPPVRVYGRRPPRRRRIAIGVVAATAVLAFAIAAAALTLPELIAGESIGKSGSDTTLFGGRDRDRPEERERPETVPPAQEVEPPKTTPEEEEKQETEPPAQEPRTEEEPPPTETTPAPPELPQQ